MRVCGTCKHIREFTNDEGYKIRICNEASIEKVSQGMYKITHVSLYRDAINCWQYVVKDDERLNK